MLWPEAQRRDEIRFFFAKSVPYNHRLMLIAGLLVMGFITQITINPWAGAVLLFIATLLSVVHGYSNVPERMSDQKSWGPGDRDQLENILLINRKAKKWDQSLMDVSCTLGFFFFLVTGAVIFIVGYQFWIMREEWLMEVWLIDTIVLLVPHWITGVRRILVNAPMITKIELFLKIWDYWKSSNPAGQTIEPQIEVRKGPKGDIPVDVKMILRTDNGGPDFLGLQMQVSMNSVQGHDYPYFYCVLVAKHEFHLLDRLALWEKSKTQTRREVITEGDREAEVDIIVIRQQTSRSGGYHTKYPQAVIIFEFARALMLELLKINR